MFSISVRLAAVFEASNSPNAILMGRVGEMASHSEGRVPEGWAVKPAFRPSSAEETEEERKRAIYFPPKQYPTPPTFAAPKWLRVVFRAEVMMASTWD